jgi:prepilin-type N-terminal cleavage/methylation domain-containing protein
MKKAFTMLELVFVLVVIGILAAVMLPQMESTKLREAAIQVISHIRYTQHLAMVDDKFNSTDPLWFRKRWQIIFANTTAGTPNVRYSIFSDESATGNPDTTEIAKDPQNTNKVLSGGHSNLNPSFDDSLNDKLNLTQTYAITKSELKKGCTGARIAFDHMGRPIDGSLASTNAAYNTNRLIQNDVNGDPCEIVLTSPEGTITIAIEPETGYAHIL